MRGSAGEDVGIVMVFEIGMVFEVGRVEVYGDGEVCECELECEGEGKDGMVVRGYARMIREWLVREQELTIKHGPVHDEALHLVHGLPSPLA